MNYKIFNEVYLENKKLDKMFDNTFNDKDMYKKNKLELLVEIGELANETKCFKYWKKPTIDINLIEEEFADCLIMTFYFFNIMNISLDETFMEIDEYDKVDIFGRLYKLSSDFYYHDERNIIKEIFVTLINLGYLIGFTNEDIIKAGIKKINKNKAKFEELS